MDAFIIYILQIKKKSKAQRLSSLSRVMKLSVVELDFRTRQLFHSLPPIGRTKKVGGF